ncbi:hypothetical protein Tco_1550534 [Tanacetum coccineum]
MKRISSWRDCRQPLRCVGNVHKTSHELAKENDYLVLMAEATRSLKEDLGESWKLRWLWGFVVVDGRSSSVSKSVGASRGEVKGSGIVFGVSRIEFGMIPEDNIGESGCEAFRLDGGAD